jgi:signal transduction histidine kinase
LPFETICIILPDNIYTICDSISFNREKTFTGFLNSYNAIDKPDLTDVNIGDLILILGSLNFIRQKAFKHDIDIHFSLSDNLRNLIMRLDKRKMKQILFNLLSNALNLTPDGVQVGVLAEKLMIKNRESVVISIIDNRIGIDAEYHGNIFEESLQAEEDKKNQIQSCGLELRLTRSLGKLQGGTLLANRQEGKGNRVTVVLPV